VKAEFALYTLADGVVAITKDTMQRMKRLLPATPMGILPFVSHTAGSKLRCTTAHNSTQPSAVLVGDIHMGNVNGLLWFVDAVLPLLPAGFVLHLVGNLALAVGSKTKTNLHLAPVRASLCPRLPSPDAPACVVLQGRKTYAALAALICMASAAINPSLEPSGVSTKSILALSLGSAVVTNTLDGTFPSGEPLPPFVRMCEPLDARCFANELVAAAAGGEALRDARANAPRYIDQLYGPAAYDLALQSTLDRLGVVCDE
jgi:hypothetical protein